MLADLRGKGEVSLEADVAVIGGGTIGLPFAARLADLSGKRVVVLESGGAQGQAGETHPLNEVVQAGTPYGGASSGRFRGLGGTSSRWGGALIPFQQADMADANWPVGEAELAPFAGQVEQFFGLEPGPYADPEFLFPTGPDFTNRLAKWPPFARRNVFALLEDRLRGGANPECWANAHVVSMETDGPGAPVRISAETTRGDRLELRAGALVLAAGAIETTRLALLLDRAHQGRIAAISSALGRYFTDHVSTEVAQIVDADRRALNRITGFRFRPGGAMRNIRFELAGDAPARATLPPGWAHIGFETDRPGGFDALRAIYQAVQKRSLPAVPDIADLLRHSPWLARAAWWRTKEKRLLFPADSRLVVHAVMQQEPRAESRITLDDEVRDAFGQPLARIDWRVSDADVENVAAFRDRFMRMWAGSGFAALGSLVEYAPDTLADRLRQGSDIYHPTGSTRMAAGPDEGVVDGDMQMFALPQVRLLSTSVLPTGGGTNPTMTALMLAMRCAVDMARA